MFATRNHRKNNRNISNNGAAIVKKNEFDNEHYMKLLLFERVMSTIVRMIELFFRFVSFRLCLKVWWNSCRFSHSLGLTGFYWLMIVDLFIDECPHHYNERNQPRASAFISNGSNDNNLRTRYKLSLIYLDKIDSSSKCVLQMRERSTYVDRYDCLNEWDLISIHWQKLRESKFEQ